MSDFMKKLLLGFCLPCDLPAWVNIPCYYICGQRMGADFRLPADSWRQDFHKGLW